MPFAFQKAAPLFSLTIFFTLLTGCAPPTPTTALPSPTTSASPAPTFTSLPTSTPAVACAGGFEKRELKEPYKRHRADEPRHTLSESELNNYLAVMGIQSMCIPEELGAPFLNADWGSQQMPGAEGRMISLGFENLYPGSGWSSGFVLYSTYDFKMGTEYDVFATLEDRDALRQGNLPDRIEVNGVRGFTRILSGLYPGTLLVQKAVVFPFETDYVAVVYQFWGSDPNNADAVQQIKDGKYPPKLAMQAEALDEFIQSIHFDPFHP